jgi:hypothetical protein
VGILRDGGGLHGVSTGVARVSPCQFDISEEMAWISEAISDEASGGVWNCLGKFDMKASNEGAMVDSRCACEMVTVAEGTVI